MARTEVRNHRKFLRLVRDLDLPEPYVLGLLEWMWQSAYESGSDFIGDEDDVELAAKWPGERGKFFRAMLENSWIDQQEDRYFIHDLWHHAPDYVKKRHERRQEQLKKNQSEAAGRTATNGDERRHSATDGAERGLPNPQQHTTTQPKEEDVPVEKKGRADVASEAFVTEHAPTLGPSPEFMAEWLRWLEYRRAERKKPVSPTAAKRQLADCEEWGIEGAISSINASIQGEWTGLFQPKGSTQRSAPPPHDPDDIAAPFRRQWTEEQLRAIGAIGDEEGGEDVAA